MSKQYIRGEREQNRAYSPAVKVMGGTTVYLAGVAGDMDAQGKSLAGDFAAQVHRCFERMQECLTPAGGTLDDLVSMTVFITDFRYADEFIAIRQGYFKQGYPASAMIGCEALARPQMLVEVQGVASLDK